MGELRDDLLREAGSGAELRETHISWVFLTKEHAYKVKRPVSLGFLDFRTLEARHAACQAEVELNRRLAPEVYLGLVPVVRDAAGAHRLATGNGGGGGDVVDWAVKMVRLPDASRADVRLEQGKLDVADIDRVAERIARFHASVRSDEETAAYGAVRVIAHNVAENFDQARDAAVEFVSAEQEREIEEWQLSVLEKKRDVIEARMRDGFVRDGHGDLRLEHVYLGRDSSDVTILDCIEFAERFRYADVCADVAFLSMDLAAAHRVDLGERLLAQYAAAANDYDSYKLVDFYESYRAYVRAKISCLVARDDRVDLATRARAARDARKYFLLSLSADRRSIFAPVVVAVGGVIASGKSTIADRLSYELGGPVVEADRTRKYLLGLQATAPVHEQPWKGAYEPVFTDRVYRELIRRAAAVLSSGRAVVLDASFRSERMRRAAQNLARENGVPFLLVECRADRDTCLERLRRRRSESGASDGRIEIFDDFCARFEAVRELRDEDHFALDTTRPIEESLAMLRARLSSWSARLTG